MPRVLLALLAVLFALPLGCGDAQNRAKASNDLKELALAYHQFRQSEGRPPKSYAELTKQVPLPPDCERVTVYWGADIVGPGIDAGDTILGYLPTRLSNGDVLAMYCDGSVRAITQAAFDAAKKARPLPDKKANEEK